MCEKDRKVKKPNQALFHFFFTYFSLIVQGCYTVLIAVIFLLASFQRWCAQITSHARGQYKTAQERTPPLTKCTSSTTFYRLHVMQRKKNFLQCSGAACEICWDKSVQYMYKLKRNIHCAECEGCVPGIPAAAAPGWHYSLHQHLHHEKVCQWPSGYCWMKKDTGVIPTTQSSGSTPLAANFRVKALMWYWFLHCKRVCRWLTAYFRTNLCERKTDISPMIKIAATG